MHVSLWRYASLMLLALTLTAAADDMTGEEQPQPSLTDQAVTLIDAGLDKAKKLFDDGQVDAAIEALNQTGAALCELMGDTSSAAAQWRRGQDNASKQTGEQAYAALAQALKASRLVLTYQPIIEAPLPEGWPSLTPVDVIQLKDYPAYRAAFLRASNDRDNANRMFNPLFQHIKKRDIAMTAPVQLEYQQQHEAAMAFLYRTTEQGSLGKDGRIEVIDVPPMRVISLGVLGGYDRSTLISAEARLNAWLEAHADTYESAGPIRRLAYNSPFIPGFMKYSEVQIPVKSRETP